MLEIFATTEVAAEGQTDLLGALGVNWQSFIIQLVSFLILLFLLKKFVFPALFSALDKREKVIEESVRAAQEAEQKAADSEAKTAQLMKKARQEADELVGSAKAEAVALVEAAEKKSRDRAKQITIAAEEEIQKSIAAAKKSLRAETVALVAEATEKVVRNTLTPTADKKLVETAVKEAEA